MAADESYTRTGGQLGWDGGACDAPEAGGAGSVSLAAGGWRRWRAAAAAAVTGRPQCRYGSTHGRMLVCQAQQRRQVATSAFKRASGVAQRPAAHLNRVSVTTGGLHECVATAGARVRRAATQPHNMPTANASGGRLGEPLPSETPVASVPDTARGAAAQGRVASQRCTPSPARAGAQPGPLRHIGEPGGTTMDGMERQASALQEAIQALSSEHQRRLEQVGSRGQR